MKSDTMMDARSYAHKVCALMMVCALCIAVGLLASCGSSSASSDGQDEQPVAESAEGEDSTAATEPGTYQHLTGEEVQQLLESDDSCVLVDVRQPLAYQYEHIDGAINLPQDQIAGTAESVLPDKDQVIILYCDYGGVSKIAAEDMVDMGYTNIIEFDGLEDWPGETVRDESIQ